MATTKRTKTTAKPATKTTAKPATETTAKPKTKPAAANPAAAKPVEAKPVEAKPDLAKAKTPTTTSSKNEGGEKAPDFKLTADDGSTVSLADFAGKSVVLYFYPKDNTPGCTREACAFQENLDAIRQKGAVVLGVSRDSAKTHAGFKTKYNLAFPLLSDPDASVHKAYGAWGTKTMYGRETTGALRSTVIIDPKGRIAKRFPNVKVDGHANAVLTALSELQGST
jgi:thioredoxin-dependent peroxiredoxin